MKEKIIITSITFFLTFALLPIQCVTSYEKASNTTLSQNDRGIILYVGGSGPGNFSKIQDAIDNATNNETIFVYDDSSPYYENIVIDKSITLLGENKTTTAIDAQGVGGNVVTITAEGVIFSGFSVLNWNDNISSQTGIYIHSNTCKIVGNIFTCTYVWYGYEALHLDHSNNSIILDNMISHTAIGIVMERSSRNIVSKNLITDTFDAGIILYVSNDNNISENLIVNNSYGINLGSSTKNKINSNEISGNVHGMTITASVKNIIMKNNFRNNIVFSVFEVFSSKPFWRNTWDANYWNRTRLLPKIIFGILDFSPVIYITIPWINVDWHPARKPYNISSLI
jgi:parallel beta-helix repeat protein